MTKRVENPKPGGRPSKFKAVFETHRDKIKILTENGLTDKQISEIFGITQQTYCNWKLKYPEFFEAIKDWKLTADGEIEVSLRDRAKGYSCPETKAQWVQDADGGRWEYAELTRRYPPDPTSMIFWLKNRQPTKWRDKQEIDIPGGITVNINPVQFGDRTPDKKG
uniref:Putative DNA binding, helix-turn-helix domain containing protein n=1 Tax=viral metagenome TaxID=1070528 RepID=A0A6M3LPK8_9ZZZZ